MHAVAGIGNPQRFFGTLVDLGLHVRGRTPFPTTTRTVPEDLAFAGADAVLMTEKDAVKCVSVRARELLVPAGRSRGGPRARQTHTRSPRRLVMDAKLLDILVCPLTKGALIYDKAKQELISVQAGLAYPIKDDIPMMLEEEARTAHAGGDRGVAEEEVTAVRREARGVRRKGAEPFTRSPALSHRGRGGLPALRAVPPLASRLTPHASPARELLRRHPRPLRLHPAARQGPGRHRRQADGGARRAARAGERCHGGVDRDRRRAHHARGAERTAARR